MRGATQTRSTLSPSDIKLAKARAAGKTLKEAGSIIGVSEATAHRRLSQPEIKALVEEITAKMIATSIPQAVENIQYVVEQYQTTDNQQVKDHGFKASTRLLEMAGIFPSHTQSVFIQQINAAGDVHITSELSQLQSFLDAQMGQTIDITPDDNDDNVQR